MAFDPRKTKQEPLSDPTRLVLLGREFSEHGMINPAVYRASTVLHPSVEALHGQSQPYTYGRYGTPTVRALESAVCQLEGGVLARLSSCGLSAISSVLLAFLKPGDHICVADSVYHPTRTFCDRFLQEWGISVSYYPPRVGAGIGAYFRKETRLVFMESPGSNTMELQDIPAISQCALAHGALSVVDNTWGAGYYVRPLSLGADVSLQAATKYLVGHADVLLGTVAFRAEEHAKRYDSVHRLMGWSVSPDDAYVCLRGIRTLDVRLERHMKNALQVAHWLEGHPEVSEVLYPALESSPDHALFKRDCTGACGLFSIVLSPQTSQEERARFLNALTLFGMGYSWGGFESLALPAVFERTVEPWKKGPVVRLHIGLESPQDLIADLSSAFDLMR